jgi:hypothetical protein
MVLRQFNETWAFKNIEEPPGPTVRRAELRKSILALASELRECLSLNLTPETPP